MRCAWILAVALVSCATSPERFGNAEELCLAGAYPIREEFSGGEPGTRTVVLGCQLDEETLHGPLLIFDDDTGRLRNLSFYVDGVSVGPLIAFHGDGSLRQLSFYRDGVLEGPLTVWHENGQVAMTAVYEAGELRGPFERWNEDGSPRSCGACEP